MILDHLTVKNLAIVETADVSFGDGLNIITGETGAGKSVLMGALSLVLGARADASAVRDGAKDAQLGATFIGTNENINNFLSEHGIEIEEDTLLVRRNISANGSKVWINDVPTTVQTLRTLGKLIVDVHGPNDHQRLVDETFQRNLLDAYAHTPKDKYATAWQAWRELKDEQLRLSNGADVSEEVERLRWALEEIDGAQLCEEDETELPRLHAQAAHAAELVKASSTIDNLFNGDNGITEHLAEITRHLAEMARWHESAKEWASQAEALSVSAQELSNSINESISRIEADEEALQRLDERMTLIQRLKRKYACTNVAELLALGQKKAARLAELEGRGERLAELDKLINDAEQVLLAAGAKLTEHRSKCASKLSHAVTKELHDLGFLKAEFSITLHPCTPTADGCDIVEFRFAPNPGEAARALADIASTGEIARVMLAVKAVCAEHDATPVLVFDEIDSNIGGETGRAVGEKLRTVATHHQVIAITHLPQSAVYGSRHLAVTKEVKNGRTISTVRELTGDERIEEIARMLGGSKMTSVVMQHASELLKNT